MGWVDGASAVARIASRSATIVQQRFSIRRTCAVQCEGNHVDRLRPKLKTGLLLGSLAIIGGCASTAPFPPHSTQDAIASSVSGSRISVGDAVAKLATQLVGVPYRYGGDHPDHGFDCSGLVFYTYSQHGISVPRTSQDLFKASEKIALRQADEGDLVFFQDQEKLSHVGIYLGRGLFVHAPSSGRTVSIASLDAPYYQRHLIAVGRILRD